jgi:hypothetical protein
MIRQAGESARMVQRTDTEERTTGRGREEIKSRPFPIAAFLSFSVFPFSLLSVRWKHGGGLEKRTRRQSFLKEETHMPSFAAASASGEAKSARTSASLGSGASDRSPPKPPEPLCCAAAAE